MTYINVFTGGSSGSGSGGGSGSVALNIQKVTSDYNIVAADDGKWFHNYDPGTPHGRIQLFLPASPVMGFVVGAISAAPEGDSWFRFVPNSGQDIQSSQAKASGGGGGIGNGSNGRPYGSVLQIAYIGNNLWHWVGGYPFDWASQ